MSNRGKRRARAGRARLDSIDDARRERVMAFETLREHFADACVRERGVRAFKSARNTTCPAPTGPAERPGKSASYC